MMSHVTSVFKRLVTLTGLALVLTAASPGPSQQEVDRFAQLAEGYAGLRYKLEHILSTRCRGAILGDFQYANLCNQVTSILSQVVIQQEAACRGGRFERQVPKEGQIAVCP